MTGHTVRARLLQENAGMKVGCVPESGVFVDTDYGGYSDGHQWIFEHMNTAATLSPSCLKKYDRRGEGWKCHFVNYFAKYLETPLFTFQSVNDEWGLKNLVGAISGDAADDYAEEMLSGRHTVFVSLPRAVAIGCHAELTIMPNVCGCQKCEFMHGHAMS